jgi:hypothetical protein
MCQNGDEIILSDEVTTWVLDFNFAVSSIREANIDSPLLDDWFGKDLLKYPALSQVLTSHLQTFGQSVIIGDKRPFINSVSWHSSKYKLCILNLSFLQMISFLSLFIDDDQRKRSRFVPVHGHTCFHMGLALQVKRNSAENIFLNFHLNFILFIGYFDQWLRIQTNILRGAD